MEKCESCELSVAVGMILNECCEGPKCVELADRFTLEDMTLKSLAEEAGCTNQGLLEFLDERVGLYRKFSDVKDLLHS